MSYAVCALSIEQVSPFREQAPFTVCRCPIAPSYDGVRRFASRAQTLLNRFQLLIRIAASMNERTAFRQGRINSTSIHMFSYGVNCFISLINNNAENEHN